MGNLKEKIKEEIREEVGDIIYEKAKEEVREKIKTKYQSFTDRMLSFFGFRETKRQKIRRIGEEIRDDQNLVASDTVLGMLELFTVNYALSMVKLASSTVSAKPEKKKEKAEIENDQPETEKE